MFLFVFIFYWGTMICFNTCHTVYSGLFARWYHGKDQEAPIHESAVVACTKAIGSICFGSLIVAFVRTMEFMARQARQEADNIVIVIVACIIECLLRCIADIIEYLNEWAYVQCAMRDVTYCQAVNITMAHCTCANMSLIIKDLLLDSVVTMGTLLCGLWSTVTTMLTVYLFMPRIGSDNDDPEAQAAATAGMMLALVMAGMCGFDVGIMVGSTGLSIFGSGIKTILVCWAESPEPLINKADSLQREFEMRANPDPDVEVEMS